MRMLSNQRVVWCALATLLLMIAEGASTPSAQTGYLHLNPVVEKLSQGKHVFGVSTSDLSLQNARSLARADIDYVYLDMEHNPMRFDQMEYFLAGLIDKAAVLRRGNAQARPAVFARFVPYGREEALWVIKHGLDIGLMGILVNNLETKEQAENVVRNMRFAQRRDSKIPHPAGLRGSGAGLASWFWGIPAGEYMQRADLWPHNPQGDLLFWPMIETPLGLQNADAIAQVPGVGGFYLGSGSDLSTSMGARVGRASRRARGVPQDPRHLQGPQPCVRRHRGRAGRRRAHEGRLQDHQLRRRQRWSHRGERLGAGGRARGRGDEVGAGGRGRRKEEELKEEEASSLPPSSYLLEIQCDSVTGDWRGSWRKRAEVAAIAALGYPLINALGHTLRWRVEGLRASRRHRRVRAASRSWRFWHGRILPATFYFRRRGIVVITSENFDGEWIARIIERFGYGTARGSTSRGARQGAAAAEARHGERASRPASRSTARAVRRASRSLAPSGWRRRPAIPCCRFISRRRRHWTLRELGPDADPEAVQHRGAGGGRADGGAGGHAGRGRSKRRAWNSSGGSARSSSARWRCCRDETGGDSTETRDPPGVIATEPGRRSRCGSGRGRVPDAGAAGRSDRL